MQIKKITKSSDFSPILFKAAAAEWIWLHRSHFLRLSSLLLLFTSEEGLRVSSLSVGHLKEQSA